MYKIGEDEMVFCPYNRYHVVSKLRIQKHIIKCKKNYPDVKLATCFYNFTHRLKPEEMLKHYEICSQKTRIDACKYFEPCGLSSSSTSVKNDSCTEKFPVVKPRFFPEPGAVSSPSDQIFCNFKESDISGHGKYSPQIHDENCSSDDDDLEPLPLPKTVSKAFVCVQKTKDKQSFDTHLKSFGRGKYFSPLSPTESARAFDHSLPDLNSTANTIENTKKNPIFFPQSNKSVSSVFKHSDMVKSRILSATSSASVTSSMLDEVSTLKSEEILSDEENSEEENSNYKFKSSKNLNKYVKI